MRRLRSWLGVLAFLVLPASFQCVLAAARQEEKPQELPPSSEALAGRPPESSARRETVSLRTLLEAPFSSVRASFFHAALEVPPLTSARAIEPGSVYLRLRSAHARSNWEEGEGISNRGEDDFDGTYREYSSLLATWAPWRGFELNGRAVLAGWDEHHDRFELFNGGGEPIVRDEDRKILDYGATSRHFNLSVFGMGAKLQLYQAEDYGFDLALSASVKFPFGRDRDLTHAGTTDVALAGLARVPTSWGAVHAQIGATIPLGRQNLFNETEGFELNAFAFAGVGVTWRLTESLAVGLQLEANTSAFRAVDFLDRPPTSVVIGARQLFGNKVVEAGVGTGFSWDSAYEWMGFLSVGFLF